MLLTARSLGRLPVSALAAGMGLCLFAVSTGLADDVNATYAVASPKKVKQPKQKAQGSESGTLGYGPPGVRPGFQGFGLGFHPGYGYGGQALGVGANGGYPLYGGPGYPHPGPTLNRPALKKIEPFCDFGGLGYPTPEQPHFFGGVGSLSPDQPVITFEPDPTATYSDTGYGAFDGAVPYPETTFAPFAGRRGEGGSSGGMNPADPSTPAPEPTPNNGPGLGAPIPPMSASPGASTGSPVKDGVLGADEESLVQPDGTRGLRISKVYQRSAAEKAGLQVGDVILSINGYLTTKPSDLVWIIADPSSGKSLKMNVRTGSDGGVRILTAQLP